MYKNARHQNVIIAKSAALVNLNNITDCPQRVKNSKLRGAQRFLTMKSWVDSAHKSLCKTQKFFFYCQKAKVKCSHLRHTRAMHRPVPPPDQSTNCIIMYIICSVLCRQNLAEKPVNFTCYRLLYTTLCTSINPTIGFMFLYHYMYRVYKL